MNKISERLNKRVYEETVETKFAETRWPVYKTYQLRGVEGCRYIWAPESAAQTSRGEVKSIDPFSPEYAGLFLEFARWFDKQKMDKAVEWGYGATLDTPRNGEAALAWAHKYGVLGLGRNVHEHSGVGGFDSSSSEIAAERLGMLRLGHNGMRAHRKSPIGGEHETVEMFVLEACEANVVLKLYEAATAKTVDVPAIARYMSDRKDFTHLPEKYRRSAKTERELWSEDGDLARSWALRVVEHTVDGKVENDVYHLLIGEPNSYKDAWGFKSLLGAMWLQMRRFMRGESDRCLRCEELFPKTRRDRVYCGDVCSGKARAAKAYEREKQRQQEAREATRSKLRG